jgi:hypothetical protein
MKRQHGPARVNVGFVVVLGLCIEAWVAVAAVVAAIT